MKKVKKFKERSSMLAPTGVEYGDMAINSVVGCSHGCLFPCYAYLIKKRFKQVNFLRKMVLSKNNLQKLCL